jgi:Fanconi anemia group M protein
MTGDGPRQRYRLVVDHSERSAPLLDLARQSDVFDVEMTRLEAGDYLVEGAVLVERKTYADFAASVADGRLFPQAVRLARSRHRPVVLVEGSPTASMPDVHPNALNGASISLAVMWRLPVLRSSDPQDSLRILRCLANQAGRAGQNVLRRYDRKPKRLASRRLYMLQGLPGVGPALAHRLLLQLGSVEGVVTADEATLMQVRGMGAKKAFRIRELVGPPSAS